MCSCRCLPAFVSLCGNPYLKKERKREKEKERRVRPEELGKRQGRVGERKKDRVKESDSEK